MKVYGIQVALLHHYRSCSGLHSGFSGLGPPVLRNKRRLDPGLDRFQQTVASSSINTLIQSLF